MWYYFTLFQTTFSKQNNPRLLPTKPLFSQERVASLLLSRLSLWEISTLLACLLTYYAGPKCFCPKQHWFCCASVLARKNVIQLTYWAGHSRMLAFDGRNTARWKSTIFKGWHKHPRLPLKGRELEIFTRIAHFPWDISVDESVTVKWTAHCNMPVFSSSTDLSHQTRAVDHPNANEVYRNGCPCWTAQILISGTSKKEGHIYSHNVQRATHIVWKY